MSTIGEEVLGDVVTANHAADEQWLKEQAEIGLREYDANPDDTYSLNETMSHMKAAIESKFGKR